MIKKHTLKYLKIAVQNKATCRIIICLLARGILRISNTKFHENIKNLFQEAEKNTENVFSSSQKKQNSK